MSTMLELAFEIDSAMANEPYYAMLTLGASKQLLKKGYVEINQDITNEDSQFATRLTAAGVEFLNSHTESAIVATPTEKAVTMTVYTNIPKPEKIKATRKAGGGRVSKYPFDGMAIGEMFFVANSAVKSGDAFKAMSSVIGAVHIRYSTPTDETRTNRKGVTVPGMARTKEFSVRSFEFEGVAGAGVWRDK